MTASRIKWCRRSACRILGETQPSDEFEAYNIQTISQELMDLYASGANRK